ncbi:MAG: HAD family phosphatase [Patescibacteria group bacterium]
MNNKKIAIFDIDGTIFRSSLLIELVELLVSEGLFPESAKDEYVDAYKKWFNRSGSYEDYISGVILAFEKNIKGINYDVFVEASRQVVELNKNRVYRYTRDLVKKLKSEEYYLIAISHSPKELVQDFCQSLGFDKVYGWVYENKEGFLTGKSLHLDLISNKSKILDRIIKKEGLKLKDSIGVGDSDGDISFLSLVDNPICFNPNGKLYKEAKKKSWPIVVERKDVIYENL